jgi:DNA mismatch repair protein MutS
VREEKGKINFLHEIRPGSSEHSYGIAVAKLAGVPENVIKEARQILLRLETGRGASEPKALEARPQLDFFQSQLGRKEAEILSSLRVLKLEEMSPLQALQWLAETQESLPIESKTES